MSEPSYKLFSNQDSYVLFNNHIVLLNDKEIYVRNLTEDDIISIKSILTSEKDKEYFRKLYLSFCDSQLQNTIISGYNNRRLIDFLNDPFNIIHKQAITRIVGLISKDYYTYRNIGKWGIRTDIFLTYLASKGIDLNNEETHRLLKPEQVVILNHLGYNLARFNLSYKQFRRIWLIGELQDPYTNEPYRVSNLMKFIPEDNDSSSDNTFTIANCTINSNSKLFEIISTISHRKEKIILDTRESVVIGTILCLSSHTNYSPIIPEDRNELFEVVQEISEALAGIDLQVYSESYTELQLNFMKFAVKIPNGYKYRISKLLAYYYRHNLHIPIEPDIISALDPSNPEVIELAIANPNIQKFKDISYYPYDANGVKLFSKKVIDKIDAILSQETESTIGEVLKTFIIRIDFNRNVTPLMITSLVSYVTIKTKDTPLYNEVCNAILELSSVKSPLIILNATKEVIEYHLEKHPTHTALTPHLYLTSLIIADKLSTEYENLQSKECLRHLRDKYYKFHYSNFEYTKNVEKEYLNKDQLIPRSLCILSDEAKLSINSVTRDLLGSSIQSPYLSPTEYIVKDSMNGSNDENIKKAMPNSAIPNVSKNLYNLI